MHIIQSAIIIKPSERNATNLRFFYWRIFAKFLPENYDFKVYEGFSMKNLAQIGQIRKKILPIARFLLLAPSVAKNVKRF